VGAAIAAGAAVFVSASVPTFLAGDAASRVTSSPTLQVVWQHTIWPS
jgi:hypothetical protein